MLMKQVKEVKSDPQVLADYPYRTIYHEFLKDKNSILPDLELRDEAVLFVNAGTDTASDALIHGSVRILDSPEICEKLQTELDNAWPTLEEVPRFEQLEKLPYLVRLCFVSRFRRCIKLEERLPSSKRHFVSVMA